MNSKKTYLLKKIFNLKFSINTYKIKIFYGKFRIKHFLLSDKNAKKKLSNVFLLERNLKINEIKISVLFRILNVFIFSSRNFLKKFIFKFIFSFEQLINRFKKCEIFQFAFFSPKEVIEKKRKEFLEYLFLQIIKKTISFKQKKQKKSSILIIIPNQTCFFQIIRSLFHSKQKRKISKFIAKNFLKGIFLKIQFGKIIKPADNRTIFSDGNEDFFSIGATIKKKNIFFTKKIFRPDFLFYTPLTIRSLKKNLFLKILKSCNCILIDNIEIIIMQNPENLFLILKYFFNLNKNKILERYKKFSVKNFNPYLDLFYFFMISDYFSSSLFFFPILSQLRNNISKISRKNLTKIIFFKKKNFIFLKFMIKKKISTNEQLLKFFKKKLTKFILKKAKTGILLFFKKYSEYIFIRNYLMKIIREKKKYKIIFLNEYLDFADIVRGKLIENVENIIILCTERFYHFYRYTIQNCVSCFFYSFPHNWEFLFEIAKMKKKFSEKKNIYIFGRFLETF